MTETSSRFCSFQGLLPAHAVAHLYGKEYDDTLTFCYDVFERVIP